MIRAWLRRRLRRPCKKKETDGLALTNAILATGSLSVNLLMQ
jgi:hypothetical protein